MTGDNKDATAWLSQHRDAIQGDASAQLLIANLNPRDKATAQAAAQVLADLHSHADSMKYVLDVFEGNTRLGLGGKPDGADQLLGALGVNPYLLGAWKDLGDSYYRGFHVDKAWACWDSARRINPHHPLLQPVTDMEGRLRASFPEYF